MNCAARLVEIFGSQADVARAFRLDRAVVNNWVKSGYVPARWAMEVEHVTEGRIAAVEVLNEAHAKKPVKVKSRPDDHLFGSPLSGKEAMNDFAPAKRISSFHPPQRTLMGPGPTEIHPRVLTTMSQPAIGYLDPVFVEMMEDGVEVSDRRLAHGRQHPGMDFRRSRTHKRPLRWMERADAYGSWTDGNPSQ